MICYLVIFFLSSILSQEHWYNHPELKWKEIETDHFIICFHQGTERSAAEVATRTIKRELRVVSFEWSAPRREPRQDEVQSMNTHIPFVFLSALSVVVASCGTPEPEPVEPTPGLTAFTGARLIIGNGDTVVETGTLLVRAGRIEAAGAAVDHRRVPLRDAVLAVGTAGQPSQCPVPKVVC